MKTYHPGALAGFDPTQTASLRAEFGRIRDAIERAFPDLTWEYRHSEPTKMVAGMVVIADGTDWNPSDGVGIYRRNEANTAWVFLEGASVALALAAHLADTTDAHDASAISNVAAGNIAATDVQAAINELDAEKQPLDATLTALAAANWAANALPIGTGADTLTQTAFAASTFPARASTGNLVAKTITDFGLSLVDDADAATARTTLALNNVTNDAQTKAAIVPNTAPSAGQMLVGNAGGTAYAPLSASGAVTLASTGAFTLATPGTLTVSSTNSTATAHTHAITSSNAPGAAASLLATDASGHIGLTGTRIVKGWFTDLTVTNAIAASITGTAANVTTNANLTGVITSVGNATSIASQTGTGTKFVVDTSPTLVTPNIGAATGSGLALSKSGTSVDASWKETGTSGITWTLKATSGSIFEFTNDAGAAQEYRFTNGTIGSTANRVVKGWFTDLQVTNNIAGSITGNAATVTTNANLTGDVTSVGNATTLTNAPVIAKVLTGYVSGAGTVGATDSILQAIQKLNGNDATNANLTGVITSVGNATSIASQTGTGTKFVVDTSPALVTPAIGVATGTSLAVSGLLTSSSPSAGVGYAAGAGAALSQGAGSGKATGISSNVLTAQVTMNNASLAANTTVTHTITNTSVGIKDTVQINIVTTVSTANYNIWAGVAAGSFNVNLRNITAGALAEALVYNYTVIKGQNS